MKSKAVIFPEKEKVEIREEEVGGPKAGELLCASERSLISTGTESRCLLGIFDPETNWKDWVQYPFHPGYSMGARVLEVGKDVKDFKAGDTIWAPGIPHVQYFTMEAAQAVKLPQGVSEEDASWSNLACTTQLGTRRAELKLGESVGIVGLGI